MYQHIERYDRIVGWPFRRLLAGLTRLTGQDNLWHAKYTAVIGAVLTMVGPLSVYHARPGPKTAANVAMETLIACVWIITMHLFIQASQDSAPSASSLSLFTAYIMGLRVSWSLVTLALGPSLFYPPSLYGTCQWLSGVACCAGLYFLTDTRPKRPNWVQKALQALRLRPHPESAT